MAEIVKNGTPSLASTEPPPSHRINAIMGETISAGDCCRVKNDGLAWRTDASGGPGRAADFHGAADMSGIAGDPVTLFHSERFHYGSNLTPGALLYPSGDVTKKGGLADAPAFAGQMPVAFVVAAPGTLAGTKIQWLGPTITGTSVSDDIASLVVPQANVPALGASTNITAVPGAFADLAAVQAYLAGANVIPNIETRLDNLEAKVNAILALLDAANIMVGP